MSTGKKHDYYIALPVAQKLIEKLTPYCERIEVAGSVRRQRSVIGDIEIVALQKCAPVANLFGEEIARKYLLHEFLSDNDVALMKGEKPAAKYKAFQYGRFKVDLFLPESPDHWGCIFTIRTGSYDFNMWLMNVAAPRAGVKFSGGRLWRDDVLLDTPEERDVFEALMLPWIPPSQRDNQQWLEYV